MKKFYKHPKFTAVFTDEDGYFSFTGNVGGGSGAVGDRIAKIDPRFAPLNAMHLSDVNTGEPMYALVNGQYYAEQGKSDVLAKQWRISDLEAEKISKNVIFAKEKARQTAAFDLDQEVKRLKRIAAEVQLDTKPDGKKTVYDILDILKAAHVDAKIPVRVIPVYTINNLSTKDVKDIKEELSLNITKKIFDMERSFVKDAIDKVTSDIISDASIRLGLVAKWQKEASEVRSIAESIESNLCGSFVDPRASASWSGDNLYISEEYKNDLDDLDEDDRRKRVALAKFLDIDVLNVEGEDYDYDATGRWYLVLTDEEADEKAQECIESSAWAFNSGFLAGFTGIPAEMFEAVHDKCEGANDAVLQCIEKAGGIEEFAERAIHADGRGHFLSSYDGRENEEEVDGVTYYIYRQ